VGKRYRFLQTMSREIVRICDAATLDRLLLQQGILNDVDGDWLQSLDEVVRVELEKYGKIDGQSVSDLLRTLKMVMRRFRARLLGSSLSTPLQTLYMWKKIPDDVLELVGETPVHVVEYYLGRRLPKFLLDLYNFARGSFLRDDKVYGFYFHYRRFCGEF